jgi:hypothetical protein
MHLRASGARRTAFALRGEWLDEKVSYASCMKTSGRTVNFSPFVKKNSQNSQEQEHGRPDENPRQRGW